MAYEILTYQDVIDSCVDYMAGSSLAASQRDIRRAIHSSLRAMAAVSSSDYRVTRGRLQLVAAQTTGTVAYTHSTRALTLTGATWPSWAADGSVRIDNVISEIASRDSDTVVTLDSVRNPGADIDSGTSYRLYKTCYHLPADFNSTTGFLGEDMGEIGQRIPLDDYFLLERHDAATAADPAYYAIGGVQDLHGTLGLYVWPAPTTAQTYDYLYERIPRTLVYSGHETRDRAGTISVSAATVTGDSTSFESGMAGSIIRISSSSTAPTGRYGTNPFVDERVIASVTDDDLLTLDADSTTRSGVGYVITDPIDLDRCFWDAFMARCHFDLSCIRNLKTKGEAKQIFDEQLHLARCAAHRVNESPTGPIVPMQRKWVLEDT